MSRLHDGQKPFFHFGGHLRKILPSGFRTPAKFRTLLQNFEESLDRRLQNLKPKNRSDVLNISWMTQAIESLSETHNDVKSLITNLQFPSSDWDESWMDSYLNDSLKLLDVCISLSSEVSRLDQGQLLLQYAIHLLNVSDGHPPSDQRFRARDSISEWLQQVGPKGSNPVTPRSAKLEHCLDILRELVNTLYAPKIKTSARGRILLRAMYGVKVQTIFVCGVFVAAFSRSAKALVELQVPEKFLWSSTFMDVQNDINSEIRRLFGEGSLTVLKDVEAVDGRARELLALTENASEAFSSEDAEMLKNCVTELKEKVENFAQGLDLLSKQVDGFFQVVLQGRDALLCNLRVSSEQPK
ncbi:UPF0496 protein 4-like [Nymphaea colorata]|nr:UPF0496 protein 4-like [Nymphaea colorata]XP_031482998.1 UPF0496 protein 4-like [Nymphaea colorata]XP_031482999.1 UPF0496 protein 4-like [Nymphaea colorata]